MRYKNPNCEGTHCTSNSGEVRLLPTGGDGNAILCRSCFDYEIRERIRHAKEHRQPPSDEPKWADCKPYVEGEGSIPLTESTRYVLVRVRLTHPSHVDPDDVLNECDYDFTSQTEHAEVKDTELLEYYKRHPDDPPESFDHEGEEEEDPTAYDIRYVCPQCGHCWEEQYSCACDSECPNCELKSIVAFQDKERDAEWTEDENKAWAEECAKDNTQK